MKIPEIDISSLAEDELKNEQLHSIGQDLDRALSICGFVYLKNHPIDLQLIKRAFEASAKFFQQDSKTKDNVATTVESQHGYVKVGQEKFSQNSLKKVERIVLWYP